MIEIIAGLCTSVSNHLLLNMNIIKTLNTHPLSKEETLLAMLVQEFQLKMLRNVSYKYLEDRL